MREGPLRNLGYMGTWEFAGELERRAGELGVSVGSLMSPHDVWKTGEEPVDEGPPEVVSMLELARMDTDRDEKIPPADLRRLI